jgi:cystathionine gamma-synthase
VQAALRPETALLCLETPTNPLLNVSDIRAVAELVHSDPYLPEKPGSGGQGGRLLVVDNTFATPYLQRPLTMGADLVLHSTTKYLGGHSDVVGGAIVTRSAELHERLAFLQNAVGAVPGPMDCFLVLRGIKTLPVRMDRHAETASALADFLAGHSRVARVLYPFHDSHPHLEVARNQMLNGGGMVSFILEGGEVAARQVAERTRVFTLAESLGGVESLIEVPAAMTHASTADSPLAVDPGLVRLSVGLEHVDDLREDLARALQEQ